MSELDEKFEGGKEREDERGYHYMMMMATTDTEIEVEELDHYVEGLVEGEVVDLGEVGVRVLQGELREVRGYLESVGMGNLFEEGVRYLLRLEREVGVGYVGEVVREGVRGEIDENI